MRCKLYSSLLKETPMRKALILTLLCLFSLSYAGYGFSAEPGCSREVDFKNIQLDVDCLMPRSLSSYLYDRGIDLASLKAFEFVQSGKTLILFDPGMADGFILLLKDRGGAGVMLVKQNSVKGLRFDFDMQDDIYSTRDLSEDCIRQISATFQSIVSTIFNSVIMPSPLGCTLDIIDLATDLYFLRIDCMGEE